MEQNLNFTTQLDVSQVYIKTNAIKQELRKVLVGQDQSIELILAAILANGHVLIEGVPGVAKTLSAKLVAKTLDLKFSRIQFTPDLMPSDVIGTNIYNPKTSEFEFIKGPIFGNLILIDEINRAPAKTQAALFEVMEERNITVDGLSHKLDYPFLVLATQNPVEHEGTYELPEAQLDRFACKVVVDYPDLASETEILRRHQMNMNLEKLIEQVQVVMGKEDLRSIRNLVSEVRVEEKILEYIAKIVNSTRGNSDLFLGASPRASVTLLNMSKALATIRSRDFVTPDDIIQLCIPVLRHRIQMTPEKEMEGENIEGIINQLVKEIEVPR